LEDTQGLPITISITTLSLAIVDAISKTMDTAHRKGLADGRVKSE